MHLHITLAYKFTNTDEGSCNYIQDKQTVANRLQWDKSEAVGSTNAGTIVLNGFVNQNNFTQVETN